MAGTKFCEICGSLFEYTRSTKKYCNKCSVNPDSAKRSIEIAVARVNKIVDRDHMIKKCVTCGKDFATTNARRTCCSEECFNKSNKFSAPKPKDRTCVYCKNTFVSAYSAAKYCSSRCAILAKKGHDATTNCIVCGKPLSRNTTGVTCSRECFYKSPQYINNHKGRNKDKPAIDQEQILRCDVCNKPITIEKYKGQRICSPECKRIWTARASREAIEARKKLKLEPGHACDRCAKRYCVAKTTNFKVYPDTAKVDEYGCVVSCSDYTKRTVV